MKAFIHGRGWGDPHADGPKVEYAVVATYPVDHESRFAGCEVWLIDGPAHVEPRVQRHREAGAEVRVMRRTWAPTEWERED